MTTAFPPVLFLALDTYSQTGGLQRFNQRVIAALAGLAQASGAPRPRVHLMRDRADDLPPDLAAAITGFGPDRLGFIRACLAAAREARVLLVGQLNLLPVAALAKAANPALRSVLFVHGIEVWNDPAYRRRRFYEPLLLGTVDRIASVSRHTAGRMQAQFRVPPEKFALLPNAVDGPVIPRRNLPPTPILLCVARMAAHDRAKNLDAVLRAFARLAPRVPGARLEIVGDGELRPDLEALAASLDIAGHVAFLGRVEDAELEACYRRAAAFVLPSAKEGFGIVYLEAWKYGLPVICASVGAAPEIVDHGVDGFVVDPADIPALADHMETLLLDRSRAQAMGRAGTEKVVARYLDDAFRKNLADLLAQVRE